MFDIKTLNGLNRRIEKTNLCSRPEEYTEIVSNEIKHWSGTVDARLNSLSSREVTDLVCTVGLHEMLTATGNIPSSLYGIMAKQYDGKGGRNSRNILLWFKLHGFEDNNTKVQKLIKLWTTKFNDKSINFNISQDIKTFRLLGGFPCDKNSCFRANGRYAWHPIILHSQYPSFVIVIDDSVQVIGRCWGIVCPKDNILVSNCYISNANLNSGYFHEVIVKATEKEFPNRIAMGKAPIGVYGNNDMTLLSTKGRLGEYSELLPMLLESKCLKCSERTDMSLTHTWICKECEADVAECPLDNCFLCRGQYVADAGHVIRDFNTSICQRCFNNRAYRCQRCENFTVDINNVGDTLCERCRDRVREVPPANPDYYRVRFDAWTQVNNDEIFIAPRRR